MIHDHTGARQWKSVEVKDKNRIRPMGFGNNVDQHVIQGVPASMSTWVAPMIDQSAPQRTTLFFLGLSYTNVKYFGIDNKRKLAELPGAIHDAKLFFEQWKNVPNTNVVCMTDFNVTARNLCKGVFDEKDCRFCEPTVKSLKNTFLVSLPKMANVTRFVMQISCHGIPGGLLLYDEKQQVTTLCNNEFTDMLMKMGQARKICWPREMVCHPLQLTVYIDRCHAGDTIPLQWVFGIQSNSIKKISVDKDKSLYAKTSPESCHMLAVVVSACPPDCRTPESSYSLSKRPCGLFTYLMHKQVSGGSCKTSLNELIYGWSVFNSHTFSMVPLIWFYMDKDVTNRMKAGFYWSTNVECSGTDNLDIYTLP